VGRSPSDTDALKMNLHRILLLDTNSLSINSMALFESRLKAAYYDGFEDNYLAVKNILSEQEFAESNDDIWLLWLPHKPLSSHIIQQYGGNKVSIDVINIL
jgi:hypothetical protein